MHVLKNLARGLSSQLLKFSLFFAAISAATVAILGTPEPLKQALHDSGLYTKITGNVIESAKREQAKNQPSEANNLDLNDPAIVKAVSDALPPEYLEQTSNSALDSLFDWLEGKTQTPQITIDLSEPKQKLATGIGEAAYAKAAAKPICTVNQLRSLDRNNLDIFNVPCVPPGIDLRAEQTKLVNQIANSNELIPDTTITFEDINKGKDGPAIDFEQLDKVPLAFKIFSSSALIWGVVALVAGAVVVLLHDERRRGVWVVGRSLLVTGVFLIIIALVATYVAGQVKASAGNQNDLMLLVPGIVTDITSQFNKVLFIFGAIYTVTGAGTMLTLYFTKPKQPLPADLAPHAPSDSTTPALAEQPDPEDTAKNSIK